MPVPAPEVPCRPAMPGEIPRNAQSLTRLATDNGWAVRTTYARGPWPVRDGFKVVDSIAVRMHRDGVVVAIWHDSHFHGGLSQSRTYTLREMRELVAVAR
jgi:hypothetical protein